MLKIIKKLQLVFKAINQIDNWGDYLGDHLNLKRGFIIYNIKGKRIKTRAGTTDKNIITEIVLTDKYFPEWLRLENDGVVIDLGAHIGIFSVMVNRKVYAIEPNKENFGLLSENIKLNHNNITPIKLAISDKNGKETLWNGVHSARNSLTRIETENSEVVNTMTLKHFFDKNKIKKCDLLKIDVEGAEYKILYSTPDSIFNKIKRIVMEIHPIEGKSKQELVEFIKSKNFDVRFNPYESILWALKKEKV